MTYGFLPATKEEFDRSGIGVPDFVYVSGDAYVDHPSFGAAIITRILDAAGFSVAVLAAATTAPRSISESDGHARGEYSHTGICNKYFGFERHISLKYAARRYFLAGHLK